MNPKPNVLLLADTTHPAQAVTDHIKAATGSEVFHWHVLNPLRCKTLDKLDLSLFDAVGLHYSIKPYNHYYVSVPLKKNIAAFKGVKFLFLQDEYQQVNLVQNFLYELGFDVLFTLVRQTMLEKAYPDPRLQDLKKITVLTGYVHENLKYIASLPVKERLIDVSYRARYCEYWLGRLAQDKARIASEFLRHTRDEGLNLNISLEESDRVYGEAWWQLLQNSKAVLGTESGASIWDFDNTIRSKTNRFLAKHKHADFETVYEAVLKPYDGHLLYNAVSPRVFEAAAARTPMIMFPGDYSGVCKPGLHYIVLEKDFSNIREVLAQLKDTDHLQTIADRTYRDLIASEAYSEHQLSALVSQVLSDALSNRQRRNIELDLVSNIETTIKKHKYLNHVRCFYTEIRFVVAQGWALLCDPKYTLAQKLNALWRGVRRYLVYLLPRLNS